MYTLPMLFHPTKSKKTRVISFCLPLALSLVFVLTIYSSNAFAYSKIVQNPIQTQFSQQERIGFHSGDDWEPSMTSDRFGHIYAIYKHYDVQGGQTCPGCNLHMLFQRSDDGGQTWSKPRPIAPIIVKYSGQDDPQIVVDPVDGRTVWASFMVNYPHAYIAVVKSDDFGETWSSPVDVSARRPNFDKDELTVRGQTVAVAYDDGFNTWASVTLDSGNHWAVYEIFLFGESGAPPPCRPCGFSYLSAQDAIKIGSDDSIYLLWNGTIGVHNFAPERILFVRSTDDGSTYSRPVDVSDAPNGIEHSFPALTVGKDAGDVRLGWMDTRTGAWNVFFRSSTDGGVHLSPTIRVSGYVPGYTYLTKAGFMLPYGDYFQMTVDEDNNTQMAFGEGPSYAGPGNIWVSHSLGN
jgi:hypothetical protein